MYIDIPLHINRYMQSSLGTFIEVLFLGDSGRQGREPEGTTGLSSEPFTLGRALLLASAVWLRSCGKSTGNLGASPRLQSTTVLRFRGTGLLFMSHNMASSSLGVHKCGRVPPRQGRVCVLPSGCALGPIKIASTRHREAYRSESTFRHTTLA